MKKSSSQPTNDRRNVSFDIDDRILSIRKIPALSEEEISTLFYSDVEIKMMKDDAAKERATTYQQTSAKQATLKDIRLSTAQTKGLDLSYLKHIIDDVDVDADEEEGKGKGEHEEEEEEEGRTTNSTSSPAIKRQTPRPKRESVRESRNSVPQRPRPLFDPSKIRRSTIVRPNQQPSTRGIPPLPNQTALVSSLLDELDADDDINDIDDDEW
jgi:hypothetical protein